MVADATLIEVTRKDIRQPFQAKLVLMDYAANLALLNIENSNFWDGLNPIKWSPVKNKSKVDAIDVYSFKIKSAHKWEIESGTIQLMTVGHRRVSDAWFPILKLSGFSKARQGYPLLQENEAVGMILETDKRKAIPTQMLLEFLEHAGKATYNSLAHRGFSWRKLPQPSTADYFKIPPALPGIWISRVLPYGTGSEVLKHGDYLTKIGNHNNISQKILLFIKEKKKVKLMINKGYKDLTRFDYNYNLNKYFLEINELYQKLNIKF